MGCAASVDFVNDYSPQWLAEFEALQFTKSELIKLEEIFEKIDDSADGQIDLIELLDFVDIKVCPFAKRTFAIFDEDQSGTIDFREFVLSLWNFCSCTDSSLRLFAFDLYDNDASGRIEVNEVELMLKEVYGEGYDSSVHAPYLMNKVQKLTSGSDRCISVEQFALFSKENPALLFPAFEMQRKLQKKIMGLQFWDKHLNRRIKLTEDGGTYISVKQILEMKLNENAFKQLVESPLKSEAQVARDHRLSLETNEQAELAINSAGVRGTRKEKQGKAAFKSAVKMTQVTGQFNNNKGSANKKGTIQHQPQGGMKKAGGTHHNGESKGKEKKLASWGDEVHQPKHQSHHNRGMRHSG